jgi:translocation and assembly module TamA
MEIQVNESKHRSIVGGVSYTTARGVGAVAEWDHRNVRGMGERINVHATVWAKTQDGRVSYVLPDFRKKNQDLIYLAEVEHEITKGYTETSFSASAIIENKINKRLNVSYGGLYKWISIGRSENNGVFNLLKIPLQVRWSTSNSLLDPTSGYSFNLKTSPTMQIRVPSYFYCPSTLTSTFYMPFTEDHRFVLAAKAVVGTIFGSSRHEIPPSELFYSGSENTLRGYKYLTVSPLDHDNKPTGGRSIMVFSFEGRVRLSETIGFVGFYEIGNVYKSSLPEINHKQLQSAGLGFRYHTPIGPIRFDVAFPLTRRDKHQHNKDLKAGKKPKKLDSLFEAYISIGQAF